LSVEKAAREDLEAWSLEVRINVDNMIDDYVFFG
jgi:hypothetical protein